MNSAPIIAKVKSCSCKQCRAGRHAFDRELRKRSRRHWSRQTRRLASDPEGDAVVTFFGGGYTD